MTALVLPMLLFAHWLLRARTPAYERAFTALSGAFVATVLRGSRERFAFGVLTTGLLAILLINAVNPDALVARVNVGLMEAGERFDAYYLTRLSADAAPVLVESLPHMSELDRRMIEDHLRARWGGEGDWRTWNPSRSRARHLVEARLPTPKEPARSAKPGVKSRYRVTR